MKSNEIIIYAYFDEKASHASSWAALSELTTSRTRDGGVGISICACLPLAIDGEDLCWSGVPLH